MDKKIAEFISIQVLKDLDDLIIDEVERAVPPEKVEEVQNEVYRILKENLNGTK